LLFCGLPVSAAKVSGVEETLARARKSETLRIDPPQYFTQQVLTIAVIASCHNRNGPPRHADRARSSNTGRIVGAYLLRCDSFK
jgi:hypothetical protein